MPRRPSSSDIPRPPVAAVLAELVGREVDVPTGYGWVRMHCPFHEDRTPSAAVDHDANSFRCHSCGRYGDMPKLLERELRLTTRQAMEKARSLAGEDDKTARPARKRRASDLLKRGD